ncbi:MAG: hypothetical protein JKY46_02740 [Robiginitomaculum sp.]|nr:hypothetical protein [Robiginitomaculum sp.]
MNQFLAIISGFALFFVAFTANAQTSLAALSGYQQAVSLNYNNATLDFNFDLPPEPGLASLIFKADPLAEQPQPGSYFLLSINQSPSVSFAPIAKGFTARFDIPAGQLVSGRNNIELTFMPASNRQCLGKADGGWAIDMQLSRLDLALGRPKPNLTELENWLAADIGAPQKIAIEQGQMSMEAYKEFGALIVQALSVRMNEIPQLTEETRYADLIIRPAVDGDTKLAIRINTDNSAPIMIFSAKNDQEIITASRWFAKYRIPQNAQQKSLKYWPKHAVTLAAPLKQLLLASNDSMRRAQGRHVSLRLPPKTNAKLQIEAHRDNRAERKSRLQIYVDRDKIAAPSLWRRVNNFSLAIPASPSNDRKIALLAETQLKHGNENSCPSPSAPVLATTKRISLQLSGLDNLSDLDRLAWNGGVFVADNGKNTQILLADEPQALFQSWRFLAHLARIGNASMHQAKFGGQPDPDFNVLAIQPRGLLPPQLVSRLQKSFAKGAGHAPGDPYPKYKRPRLTRSAFADTSYIPAMGVAASVKLDNKQVWLAISAEDNGQLSLALKDLVEGQALDHFSGTVLRWRGSKVFVNATQQKLTTAIFTKQSLSWRILLLLLLIAGLLPLIYFGRLNSN